MFNEQQILLFLEVTQKPKSVKNTARDLKDSQGRS